MKNLNKYLLSFALIGAVSVFAQDVVEGEATTTQALLQMVLEGRTSEQTANSKKRGLTLGATKKQASCKTSSRKRESLRETRRKLQTPLEKRIQSK